MAIQFPNNPGTGSVYVDPVTSQSFVYNGVSWVRQITGKGIPDAPVDSTQYAREDAAWAKLAPEIMFLGAFTAAPVLDNYGEPIQAGHVYFNTLTNQQYTYTGTVWQEFATTISIAGLKRYIWNLVTPIAIDAPLVGNDDYGNTPSGWKNSELQSISVYRNGKRLIEERDAGLFLADYIIDYSSSRVIPKSDAWDINDEIVIQIVDIVEDEPALHPYVDGIYDGQGNSLDRVFLAPDEIKNFMIVGGNFDQNTSVEGDGLLRILGVTAISDSEVVLQLQGYSEPATHPITVYNTDRIQFGTNLTVESAGEYFSTTWDIRRSQDEVVLPSVFLSHYPIRQMSFLYFLQSFF